MRREDKKDPAEYYALEKASGAIFYGGNNYYGKQNYICDQSGRTLPYQLCEHLGA